MARKISSQAVVLFGATGDLTKRKLLPAFWHLWSDGHLPKGFALVGYARSRMTDEEFREYAFDNIKQFSDEPPVGDAWDAFVPRLSYRQGGFADEGALSGLREHLEKVDAEFGTEGRRFFDAAVPPDVYGDIVRRIGEAGLQENAKIVLEKPFGRDIESARELNRVIHSVFHESQVFRIDHYLGKETVQNILAFRFANGMFEPIWNRRYIDHVQITVAENIGIEGRGAFYEQVGNIRDMISTHLFQVMTFVAMEPPVSFEPDRLRDETVKALRATEIANPERVVRGQYEGYLDEPGVSADSTTETFSAMELDIDNWRWAGVPFYLRAGKALGDKVSEITLKFRKVPFNVFKGREEIGLPMRDHLTIRVQPNEGITIAVNAKQPGPGMRLGRVAMEFDYAEDFAGSEISDAYELLILEAMRGDHSLFIRQDGVERAWEILQPILDDPPKVCAYEPGSWGPPEADTLVAPRAWHLTGIQAPHDYRSRAYPLVWEQES
ncbi:MAG TPA: glucose-6-phosphate dehydrogenase [Actinomycetota bacterium]|nr:glucose-6-phosphate dehydrogenase [Actinomycetota bacterium]